MYVENSLSLRERARVRVDDNSVFPAKPVLVETRSGNPGVEVGCCMAKPAAHRTAIIPRGTMKDPDAVSGGLD